MHSRYIFQLPMSEQWHIIILYDSCRIPPCRRPLEVISKINEITKGDYDLDDMRNVECETIRMGKCDGTYPDWKEWQVVCNITAEQAFALINCDLINKGWKVFSVDGGCNPHKNNQLGSVAVYSHDYMWQLIRRI